MSTVTDTIVYFDGFFCVVGKVTPGSKREFTFNETIEANRMCPRQLFTDSFTYLGMTIEPGMMTQDLPDRIQGTYYMEPVAQDKDSYYLNAFRTPWNGRYYDNEPVNVNRVYLQAGDTYTIQHNQCLMVGVGTVNISRELSTVEAIAPKIVDCRISSQLTVTAVTDAVICEVWV